MQTEMQFQRSFNIEPRAVHHLRLTQKNRKADISRSIASLGSEQQQQQVEGIFGLRPIDYSIVPPIPHSPPPPPAKPGLQKYLFPFTLAFTAATVGYFCMNNKNDNYEYWRAMQSGEALQIDDDEEDDYEEEEE